MLNEEKVRYLTELAIFEKKEGKKIFPVNRYFKKDYVGGHMFRSFFGYTFCYLLFLSMWVLYELDEFMGGVTLEELLAMGKHWGLIYAAGLAVYLFITWRVYGLRYDYASRAQTMYASRLKQLLNRYGREKPEKTKENRGGRGR